jgi:hypothetical protein
LAILKPCHRSGRCSQLSNPRDSIGKKIDVLRHHPECAYHRCFSSPPTLSSWFPPRRLSRSLSLFWFSAQFGGVDGRIGFSNAVVGVGASWGEGLDANEDSFEAVRGLIFVTSMSMSLATLSEMLSWSTLSLLSRSGLPSVGRCGSIPGRKAPRRPKGSFQLELALMSEC